MYVQGNLGFVWHPQTPFSYIFMGPETLAVQTICPGGKLKCASCQKGLGSLAIRYLFVPLNINESSLVLRFQCVASSGDEIKFSQIRLPPLIICLDGGWVVG